MASSAIGGVFVALGLDSAEFQTGLKEAATSSARFADDVAKRFKATESSAASLAVSFSKGLVVAAAGAAAGFLSVNAVLDGTKAALEKFGDLADKAASSGLNPEFFQGLAHGASLAGVDMNSLSGALDTFNKNAGLAAEGKGKLVSQLQALSPELLRNIQLSTSQEQRLLAVADALAAEADGSRQAAIATAAFGDQGVKLVAVLNQGAASIQAMVDKAKAMGLVVPADLVARADELGDKLDTAQQIIDTQIKIGLTDLAPLMVDVANGAASFAHWLGVGYQQMKNMGAEKENLRNVLGQLEALKTENRDFAQAGDVRALQGATLFDTMNPKVNSAGSGVTASQFEWFTGQQLVPQATKVAADTATGIVGDAGIDLALNPLLDFPDKFATGLEDMNTRSTGALGKLREATGLAQIGFVGLGDVAKNAAEMSSSQMLGSVSEITSTLAGAFEDNKLLAAANIVVSTAAGAMKAWEQGGMFGAPMAAAIVAAGAMQLAAVKNAHPGSSSIGGGSVPSASPAPVAPASEAPSQSVNVTLQGQSYGRDQIRDLLDQIGSALGDGMTLKVTG